MVTLIVSPGAVGWAVAVVPPAFAGACHTGYQDPSRTSVRQQQHALTRPARLVPALLRCDTHCPRDPDGLGGEPNLLGKCGEQEVRRQHLAVEGLGADGDRGDSPGRSDRWRCSSARAMSSK